MKFYKWRTIETELTVIAQFDTIHALISIFNFFPLIENSPTQLEIPLDYKQLKFRSM